MKDNLPFFSHDNDASGNKRMKALRAQFGWAGYGWFWHLNEAVARSDGAALDLRSKLTRADLAVDLGITIPQLEAFLAFLCDPEDCGLIHYKNGVVTTDRTQEDLARVMENRVRKRKDGKPVNHAETPFSAPESQNGAPFSQSGAPKTHRVEESRGEQSRTSSGFNDEFAEFAAARENAAAETPVENYRDQDGLPDFDPVPSDHLAIPSGTRFSVKDLTALRIEAGPRSQELLDVYAVKKTQHGYRYANDWAAIKAFALQVGGVLAWLDKATGLLPQNPLQAAASRPRPAQVETPLTAAEEAEVAAMFEAFNRGEFKAHRAGAG